MDKFIVAEKMQMSQIFGKDGKVIPVTILKSPGVKIVQVKTQEKDKYSAVQVGFGRKKKANKANLGHTKGLQSFRKITEFKVSSPDDYKRGQEVKIDSFSIGDKVSVTAEMKGRGFTGPVKRYGFRGAPASHGHDHPRAVGAIGGRYPQHVRKGLRMAGRMGGTRTVKNLEVIDIDLKRNLIALKGAVPGANGAIVKIKAQSK
jgi:large subunit ribosomal protein L3